MRRETQHGEEQNVRGVAKRLIGERRKGVRVRVRVRVTGVVVTLGVAWFDFCVPPIIFALAPFRNSSMEG